MVFGTFGRKHGTIVMGFRTGGLSMKVLKKTAELEAKPVSSGPEEKQNKPIVIPPKTRLFLEHRNREKDEAKGTTVN